MTRGILAKGKNSGSSEHETSGSRVENTYTRDFSARSLAAGLYTRPRTSSQAHADTHRHRERRKSSSVMIAGGW